MTFREALAQLVDGTPGARAAVIMGSDGIAVEEYHAGDPPIDLATTAVECQRILEEARKVVGLLGDSGGDLEQLMLQTGDHQLLFHPIDDEYFLVLALNRGGFLGKARYLLGGLLREIRREF